jgi:uncharacterized membrane protein
MDPERPAGGDHHVKEPRPAAPPRTRALTPVLALAALVALAAVGAAIAAARPASSPPAPVTVEQSAIIPTYYRDVKPILDAKCVSCHVEGGIGPFSLVKPEEAVAHADEIANAVMSGVMPPWPPGPDSQPFLNERRLGAASRQVIADWARAGAPLGRP